MHEGFKDNASASSYIIFSKEKLRTKKDWESIFLREVDPNTIFLGNREGEKTYRESISKVVDYIYGNLGKKEYPLSVYEIEDWKENLRDESSELFKGLESSIQDGILDALELVESSSLGGNLKGDMALDLIFDIPYFHGDTKKFDEFIKETTRIYANRMIFLEEEFYTYRMDVCTDSKICYTSSFLRFNFPGIIVKDYGIIQYFRIEHGQK